MDRDAAAARRRAAVRHRAVDHRGGADPDRRPASGIGADRAARRRAGRRRARAVRLVDRLHRSSARSSSPRRCCSHGARAALRVPRALRSPASARARRARSSRSASITCAAVGVRVQHRDGGHAAADRDRRSSARSPTSTTDKTDERTRGLRPAAAAGGRRADADARLRRQRRRPAWRPVGSPPNLIGRGLIEEATGERIGFLDWMLMALPICALMFVALVAGPASAEPARDQADRGRQGVHPGGARKLGDVAGGAEHADRVRHRRRPVDRPRLHRHVRRQRLENVRRRSRNQLDGASSPCSGPRCSSCFPPIGPSKSAP